MDTEERTAIQNEQNYFGGLLSDKKPPSNCITNVRLRFDSDGDLFFAFTTAGNDIYTVCVVLKDKKNLGWKECRSLFSAMQMAQRGTEMSPIVFGNRLKAIAESLGRVDGPTTFLSFSIATIIPGTSSMRVTDPDTITSTGLDFNSDGDIVVTSQTKCGSTYTIIIQLHLQNIELTVLEGQAFALALQILETGDVLPPDGFLTFAVGLKRMFNRVNVAKNEQKYVIAVRPTPVENNVPLPDIVHEAAQRFLPSSQSSRSSIAPSASPRANGSYQYKNITIVRPLKESGQAQVFEARKGSQKVALKVYNDTGRQHDESYKTEVKMLLKMSYHPNVVTVLDFFGEPKPAIAMEFVEGEDLFDYLHNNRRPSEAEGLKLVIGIAEGLYHLHKNNIIHLDMKTPNILRRSDGSPVIIDLGLSAILERDNARSGRRQGARIGKNTSLRDPGHTVLETYIMQKTEGGKGSLLWMAPEMLTQSEWSDRTDVYAFGIIMWEVFSGKQPFIPDLSQTITADGLKILIATGHRPSMAHVSHINEKLKRIITMCWDNDPKRRPTMMRVLEMLRRTDPKALFESFDQDKNGELEFSEFTSFLQKYASQIQDPFKISALFKAIDTDGSGSIGFDEFEKFWSSVETHGLDAFISNRGAKKVKAAQAAKPKRFDDCVIQ